MSPSGVTNVDDWTVYILLICLTILVVLLVLLYKKLNKDANGQYTIRRMVYKDGGIRDRLRGAVVVLETRLGIHMWPRSEEEEEGEEMQDVRVEEGNIKRGDERCESEGEEERDEGEGGDCSSDDYSSLEGCDMREKAKLSWQEEKKGEMEGKTEERSAEKGKCREDGGSQEGAEGGEGGGGGGGCLLIDLKQFSGSAIWSEDKKDEQDKENDVTAL